MPSPRPPNPESGCESASPKSPPASNSWKRSKRRPKRKRPSITSCLRWSCSRRRSRFGSRNTNATCAGRPR
ncbi:MAG: hypothetical protein D6741_12560, partial [Planctomycetota bacterium]